MNILKDICKDHIYEIRESSEIRKISLWKYKHDNRNENLAEDKVRNNSKEISQKLEKKYRAMENMKENQEERLRAGGLTLDK